MKLAEQVKKICSESEGEVNLAPMGREIMQAVCKCNGVTAPEYLTDQNLLKEFAKLVAEKVGANPSGPQLLDFLTQSGIQSDDASAFLSQLGY